MAALGRFTQLSAPRQALVRLFQSVNFGHVLGIAIQNGDPVFHPKPIVLLDVKLDVDEGERQEADLPDFTLRDEVLRLMARLDQLKNGRIERIDVRSGVPRRVVIERRLTEAPLC
ncbi:MAG TPA: hypothetical protein VK335_22425 [Bryobacteraceae bacterium]|nr:hypothetical protein [Bryobacteraceae bacterium]